MFSLPRGRVFALLSLPGELVLPRGSGFQIGETFYSIERKMQELLHLFKGNCRQLQNQVFLCCFISIIAHFRGDGQGWN